MKEKQNEPHGSNFALFQCRSTYMIFICFKPFVGYYWYIYMYTHNFQVSIKLNCMSGIQYIILNKYPRNNILTLRAVINTLLFFCCSVSYQNHSILFTHQVLPDLHRCGYNKFYIKKSMLYVCQNKVTAGYFSLQYFDLSS